MSGWVKTHRKLLEHPRFAQAGWLQVWTYLQLEATHKPICKLFNGVVTELKPGQLLAGRKLISKKTGIGESTVQRLLDTMEIEQQIEQQTSNKNRLITIKNWEKYQGQDFDEQQNEQQLNNKRTTTEQQLNTLQEDQELKNKERERVPRQPRERKSAEFAPSSNALTLFQVWKRAFPHDDAPKVQTCKNIMGRLRANSVQQLVFCVLKYANVVKKEMESKPDGKVMTYKGSNFFGEKAYFETYMPDKVQIGDAKVLARIEQVWNAALPQAPSSPGSAGPGVPPDSIEKLVTGEK